MPLRIPISKIIQNSLIVEPPKIINDRMTTQVVPDVLKVRDNVWFKDKFMIPGMVRLPLDFSWFSRILSKIYLKENDLF